MLVTGRRCLCGHKDTNLRAIHLVLEEIENRKGSRRKSQYLPQPISAAKMQRISDNLSDVAKETRKRDVSRLFRVIREILYRLAFRLPAFVQTPSARADSVFHQSEFNQAFMSSLFVKVVPLPSAISFSALSTRA